MSQLLLQIPEAHLARKIEPNPKYNESKKLKRDEAKKEGMCTQCLVKPSIIQRLTCRDCLMEKIIRDSFKFDRTRKLRGLTQARSSCYVDQFATGFRKSWINLIKSKWTGYCYYSGLPIEIGSTAGLDHMLPVSRASVFGPSRVFHPDNLVWTDKRINVLKGRMTADEFYVWLRKDLPAALATVDNNLKGSVCGYVMPRSENLMVNSVFSGGL